MSIDFTCDCDECGARLDDSEEVYCRDCYEESKEDAEQEDWRERAASTVRAFAFRRQLVGEVDARTAELFEELAREFEPARVVKPEQAAAAGVALSAPSPEAPHA